jgi:predicted RNase H-like HicB family nuclease
MNQAEDTDTDELRPEYTSADFASAVRGKYAGKIANRRARVTIECTPQPDGTWYARIPGLPGVGVHADTRESTICSVKGEALAALAERLVHADISPNELDFAVFDMEAALSQQHCNE